MMTEKVFQVRPTPQYEKCIEVANEKPSADLDTLQEILERIRQKTDKLEKKKRLSKSDMVDLNLAKGNPVIFELEYV